MVRPVFVSHRPPLCKTSHTYSVGCKYPSCVTHRVSAFSPRRSDRRAIHNQRHDGRRLRLPRRPRAARHRPSRQAHRRARRQVPAPRRRGRLHRRDQGHRRPPRGETHLRGRLHRDRLPLRRRRHLLHQARRPRGALRQARRRVRQVQAHLRRTPALLAAVRPRRHPSSRLREKRRLGTHQEDGRIQPVRRDDPPPVRLHQGHVGQRLQGDPDHYAGRRQAQGDPQGDQPGRGSVHLHGLVPHVLRRRHRRSRRDRPQGREGH